MELRVVVGGVELKYFIFMRLGSSVEFPGRLQSINISLGFLSSLKLSIEEARTPIDPQTALALQILLRSEAGGPLGRVVLPLRVNFFLQSDRFGKLQGEEQLIAGLPAREDLFLGKEVQGKFVFIDFDDIELPPGFTEPVPLRADQLRLERVAQLRELFAGEAAGFEEQIVDVHESIFILLAG